MYQCYDVASIVIKMASRELEGRCHKDDLLNKHFEKTCSVIDDFMMSDRNHGCNESYGIDVDVDTEALEIIMGIEFDFCEFKELDPMYEIFCKANKMKISISEENPNAIRVEMNFPGVWRENE